VIVGYFKNMKRLPL